MTRGQMWGWRVGCIGGVYVGQWVLGWLEAVVWRSMERASRP